MHKQLNIVSFDVPYPPNYGGVIDVFYKIKALLELGVKVHLHTFEYGRGKHQEIAEICETVTYYKRSRSPFLLFFKTPFIVRSRANSTLLNNLNKNGFPVIFEGLHTSFNLSKIRAKTYIRTHNIEHLFYKGLAKSEENILKKIFFFSESIKLKSYEKILLKTDGIFTIAPAEQSYFLKKYGGKSHYIPVFHQDSFKKHQTKKGLFVLWHGDLRVSDNIKVAKELITIFKKTTHKLVIASSFTEKSVLLRVQKNKNIQFVNTYKQEVLEDLLEKAHINILLTHQKTGIKLKLLYSLYRGKFIIANNKMIDDTGLETLCIRIKSYKEIVEKTKSIFEKEFTEEMVENRKKVLQKFTPKKSAQKLIDIVFNPS